MKELPETALKEIVDFIYFVRLRSLGGSHDDLYQLLLQLDLEQAAVSSQAHLEDEFADYERRFPQE
ncbi:MAG: hypothetical protein D6790_14970 [Caldilineae bacterium]|nr:MAG: hypothetical protein D6790_14970 [Caldilineae bacterium]